MANREMTNWVYIDDDGQEYQTKAPADIIAQVNGLAAVKVGGRDYVSADSVLPPMPRRTALNPRFRYYTAAGQARRKVICYDATCDAFAGAGTNLTLPVFNDADGAAFTPGPKRNEVKAGRDATH